MNRVAYNKTPKEKEIDIIESYNRLKNAHKVSSETGISKSTILSVLHRNNINIISYSESCGMTENNIKKIIKLKNDGKSIRNIAELLDLERKTVSRSLKRQGIEIKLNKYEVDNFFFHNIDCEEKAYYLGLITADGSVSGKTLTLCLQHRDCEIIETMKERIKYTGPIYFFKSKLKNHQDKSGISIRSKRLIDDLKTYGVVRNKTYITFFPNIPENLWSHFIRGYFDGDGCISIGKDGYADFNICGNLELIERIEQILIKFCNLNKVKLKHPKKERQSVTVLAYSGNKQIKRIGEYMYSNATIFLKRKKEKFDGL